MPGYGNVTVDIVFGGAFYAVAPASMYGLTLGQAPAEIIRSVAGDTTGIGIKAYSVMKIPCSPFLPNHVEYIFI